MALPLIGVRNKYSAYPYSDTSVTVTRISPLILLEELMTINLKSGTGQNDEIILPVKAKQTYNRQFDIKKAKVLRLVLHSVNTPLTFNSHLAC